MKTTKTYIVLFFVFAVFLLGVFKNIQYPIFWNDEGETVMFAQRVLEFGYPKVHDGRNVLNPTEQGDKGLGVKEEGDAWLPVGWVQYYYAAPFLLLSNLSDNFYVKTQIIRVAFATIGVIGLILFSIMGQQLQRGKNRVVFFILFFGMEVFSVFLYLHLRVVRLHAISLFLVALCSYLYINLCIYAKKDMLNILLLTIFLPFLYLNFPPSYFAFILSIAIIELIEVFYIDRKLGLSIFREIIKRKNILPILASFIFVIPAFFYFETGKILSEVSKGYLFDSSVYFLNVVKILSFLTRYDYLGLFVLVKLIFFYTLKRREISRELKEKSVRISFLFSIFLIVYILLISRTPYLFERYLVILQPIIVLVTLIDLFYIFSSLPKDRKFILSYVMSFLFLVSLVLKLDIIKGYINELKSPYLGPLDYAINYIDKNFDDTKNLVIATNYEEYAYMYYLGSRVTVGFVGNNLDEDRNIQPDIVIMRKGRPNNIDVLESFLEKKDYKKITFPVFDYQFNNIPEITLPIPHLFKIKFAKNDDEKLNIFVDEKAK